MTLFVSRIGTAMPLEAPAAYASGTVYRGGGGGRTLRGVRNRDFSVIISAGVLSSRAERSNASRRNRFGASACAFYDSARIARMRRMGSRAPKNSDSRRGVNGRRESLQHDGSLRQLRNSHCALPRGERGPRHKEPDYELNQQGVWLLGSKELWRDH